MGKEIHHAILAKWILDAIQKFSEDWRLSERTTLNSDYFDDVRKIESGIKGKGFTLEALAEVLKKESPPQTKSFSVYCFVDQCIEQALDEIRREYGDRLTSDLIKLNMDNYENDLPRETKVCRYKILVQAKEWLQDIVFSDRRPADQQETKPGRKEKLSMEIFRREIYPELKRRFPRGQKTRPGIKRVCAEWGKKYNVSESTIRRNFDKLQDYRE